MSERATVSRARLSTRVSPRASSRWPPGIVIAVACIVSVGLLAQTWDSIQSDPPSTCDLCEAWNAAQQPFRVFANTYYVGVAGLSAILITSSRGHVLLDGGLPQSAPRIDASIRSLGFRTDDVVLIASSHAHFDHAGGIAALQRRSGATVAASAAGARALEHGEPVPDDPQFAFGRARMGFPSVSRARIVADNETVRAGGLAITAHLTPGHTPGSTSWTWRSCDEARCLDIVYADSLNPVSAPTFRFSDHPGLVERFRESITGVARLPCDILLSVHPDFSNMGEKLAGRARADGPDPFIDRSACGAYAERAPKALERRVAEERAVLSR
jgi:metallo-beta-lactamase class B